MKGNEVTDITLVESKHNELHDAFLEIFQGRSDFQLENFVVNAHTSPERQYAQCVLELQNKYYSIKQADISRRKINHEIKNEECPFTIEEKQLELEQLDIAMLGALREFDTLYKIYQKFPRYTNEQLQKAESKYWLERLTSQAQQDIESSGSVSVGNAEALRQVGVINSYSERFFESVQNHPGVVKEKQNEMLSIQSESE
tara:strand:+ start:239 stop:838 length:600 start_codon:yes stop_codon:yes gene_type:complete